MTKNPRRRFDVAFSFEDTTFMPRYDLLFRLAKKNEVINIRCRDISKKKVNAVFEKIFGYSLEIDPLTYKGKCLKKPNRNGRPSKEIINCPIIKKEDGFVYQKLINNQINDDFTQDIRVPVFKNKIPLVYVGKKIIDSRFLTSYKTTKITEVSDVFSVEEVRKIILFCQNMGLDYTELDVLKDRDTGNLYIVDANSTPFIRIKGFSKEECDLAINRLADVFAEAFLNRKTELS